VAFSNAICLVSLNADSAGVVRRSSSGGNAFIQTFDTAGVLTDKSFEIAVFVPGAL
jgi:hypothetical protein